MIKCKEVENPECGKNCCCLYCEYRDTCNSSGKCNETIENCPSAYEEENAVTVIQEQEAALIAAISDLEKEKQEIDNKEKEMRAKLLAAMEKYGVKKFESDTVTFTYVAPTTRTSIDSAKLKKEQPDIAKEYSKTSPVSASVKISVKDK